MQRPVRSSPTQGGHSTRASRTASASAPRARTWCSPTQSCCSAPAETSSVKPSASALKRSPLGCTTSSPAPAAPACCSLCSSLSGDAVDANTVQDVCLARAAAGARRRGRSAHAGLLACTPSLHGTAAATGALRLCARGTPSGACVMHSDRMGEGNVCSSAPSPWQGLPQPANSSARDPGVSGVRSTCVCVYHLFRALCTLPAAFVATPPLLLNLQPGPRRARAPQ